MSFWIELHCDKRSSKKCYSAIGSASGDLSCNTGLSVQRIRRLLEDQAKENGWKKTNVQWICPKCQKEK